MFSIKLDERRVGRNRTRWSLSLREEPQQRRKGQKKQPGSRLRRSSSLSTKRVASPITNLSSASFFLKPFFGRVSLPSGLFWALDLLPTQNLLLFAERRTGCFSVNEKMKMHPHNVFIKIIHNKWPRFP